MLMCAGTQLEAETTATHCSESTASAGPTGREALHRKVCYCVTSCDGVQYFLPLSLPPLLFYSLTHKLTHSQTHSLTNSLTHSLTHSLNHSLTHPLTHSITHSLTHPLTHSLTHPLTHSLTNSLSSCLVCLSVCLSVSLVSPSNVKSEHEILTYLKNGTLVGLLPVPHPILIRKYQVTRSVGVASASMASQKNFRCTCMYIDSVTPTM